MYRLGFLVFGSLNDVFCPRKKFESDLIPPCLAPNSLFAHATLIHLCSIFNLERSNELRNKMNKMLINFTPTNRRWKRVLYDHRVRMNATRSCVLCLAILMVAKYDCSPCLENQKYLCNANWNFDFHSSARPIHPLRSAERAKIFWRGKYFY